MMRSSVWSGAVFVVVALPSWALAQSTEPEVRARPTLPTALQPTPGGMTADQVAVLAIQVSAQVRAARATTDAADAARTEAAMAMIPQINLSARYTRLSEVINPNLFGGLAQLGELPTRLCVNAAQGGAVTVTPVPGMCASPAIALAQPMMQQSGGGNPFQPPFNQYAFRGTLTVPITDIPFRLARLYEAAGLTQQARRLDEEATRLGAAADGRIAFYEYMRAQGQAGAAEQGIVAARRHREDLVHFVEAGTVARVELLRVEAQVAETERIVIAAGEGVAVSEANLRIRTGLLHGEPIRLGEPLDSPMVVIGDVRSHIERAWHSRPELQSLQRQIEAIGANLSAVRAGYFPSLVGVANVDIANPNQRISPPVEEFNTTWDATLQLQWSPTAAIQAGATASRVAAQREAVRAQVGALQAGIELEVRAAWTQVQTSRASLEAASRQLAAAEESYRIRRERFLAGNAISSDLSDAETDLLRAQFAIVNANIDLREGMVRLHRATGVADTAVR
jgi:outer membrane protein TolC